MSKPLYTTETKLNKLYHAINELMGKMGAEGEVHTKMQVSEKVMCILADIDDGIYDDKAKIIVVDDKTQDMFIAT